MYEPSESDMIRKKKMQELERMREDRPRVKEEFEFAATGSDSLDLCTHERVWNEVQSMSAVLHRLTYLMNRIRGEDEQNSLASVREDCPPLMQTMQEIPIILEDNRHRAIELICEIERCLYGQ